MDDAEIFRAYRRYGVELIRTGCFLMGTTCTVGYRAAVVLQRFLDHVDRLPRQPWANAASTVFRPLSGGFPSAAALVREIHSTDDTVLIYAAACTWIACKMEDSSVRLRPLVWTFERINRRRKAIPIYDAVPIPPVLLDALKGHIVWAERHVLEAVGFVSSVEYPHKFALLFVVALWEKSKGCTSNAEDAKKSTPAADRPPSARTPDEPRGEASSATSSANGGHAAAVGKAGEGPSPPSPLPPTVLRWMVSTVAYCNDAAKSAVLTAMDPAAVACAAVARAARRQPDLPPLPKAWATAMGVDGEAMEAASDLLSSRQSARENEHAAMIALVQTLERPIRPLPVGGGGGGGGAAVAGPPLTSFLPINLPPIPNVSDAEDIRDMQKRQAERRVTDATATGPHHRSKRERDADGLKRGRENDDGGRNGGPDDASSSRGDARQEVGSNRGRVEEIEKQDIETGSKRGKQEERKRDKDKGKRERDEKGSHGKGKESRRPRSEGRKRSRSRKRRHTSRRHRSRRKS